MISEQQLCQRIECLRVDVLHRWIELGLIAPRRDASGFQFDDIDEARVALVCDLHYRMGLEHESLPVILSLVDQLHRTRHSLRAIATAVSEQSDEVRVAITTRTQIVLGRNPADDR
jgi:chaperone modulatory protein CbpM